MPPPFLFSDLLPEIQFALENRTSASDQTRIYGWLRDSLVEITTSMQYRDDLVELEVRGTPFNLTALVPMYSEDLFVPAVAAPLQSGLNMATLDIILWTDPPTNSKFIKLEYNHYQNTDSVYTNSLPSSWFRFGLELGFNPTPDKAYQVQGRCLQYHPINDSDLAATQILLKREWNEILVYMSAMRGWLALEEFEKAGAVRQILYGDPKDVNNPGLLKARKPVRQREMHRTTGKIRMKVGRF